MVIWDPANRTGYQRPSALSRYGEPGGARPGGAWLQDAVPSRVPRIPSRADADLLEEGTRREAHLRVPAGLPGGLLYLYRASVPARREPVTTFMCMQSGSAKKKKKRGMCICFTVHGQMCRSSVSVFILGTISDYQWDVEPISKMQSFQSHDHFLRCVRSAGQFSSVLASYA